MLRIILCLICFISACFVDLPNTASYAKDNADIYSKTELFEVENKKVLVEAIIDVMQDQDYIIDSSNFENGLFVGSNYTSKVREVQVQVSESDKNFYTVKLAFWTNFNLENKPKKLHKEFFSALEKNLSKVSKKNKLKERQTKVFEGKEEAEILELCSNALKKDGYKVTQTDAGSSYIIASKSIRRPTSLLFKSACYAGGLAGATITMGLLAPVSVMWIMHGHTKYYVDRTVMLNTFKDGDNKVKTRINALERFFMKSHYTSNQRRFRKNYYNDEKNFYKNIYENIEKELNSRVQSSTSSAS